MRVQWQAQRNCDLLARMTASVLQTETRHRQQHSCPALVVKAPCACRAVLHIEALFQEGGRMDLAMRNRWKEAAALFSGLTAAESKAMLARLTSQGLQQNHILQAF